MDTLQYERLMTQLKKNEFIMHKILDALDFELDEEGNLIDLNEEEQNNSNEPKYKPQPVEKE